MDIGESDNGVTVPAELPGVEPRGPRSDRHRRHANADGRKEEVTEKKEKGYWHSESRYGSFHRQVRAARPGRRRTRRCEIRARRIEDTSEENPVGESQTHRGEDQLSRSKLHDRERTLAPLFLRRCIAVHQHKARARIIHEPTRFTRRSPCRRPAVAPPATGSPRPGPRRRQSRRPAAPPNSL